MGLIAIPPNPGGPGSCRVHLELSKDEARATIDRLKLMFEHLKAHGLPRPKDGPVEQKIAAATQPTPPAAPPASTPTPAPATPAASPAAPVLIPLAPAPKTAPLAAAQPVAQAVKEPTPRPPVPTFVAAAYPYGIQQQQPSVQPPTAAALPQPSFLQLQPQPQPQPQSQPQALNLSGLGMAAAAAAAAAAVRGTAAPAGMRPGAMMPPHGASLAPAPPADGLAAVRTPAAAEVSAPAVVPATVLRPAAAPFVPAAAISSSAAQAPAAAVATPSAVPFQSTVPRPVGPMAGSNAVAAAAAAAKAAAAAAVARQPAVTASAQAPAPVRPTSAAPATSSGRAAPVVPTRMAWEVCLTTDTGDHNRDPVLALQYCHALDGLPGGDGHAGWLVSSSRSLMNLWECAAGGGRGAPSLLLLHSQETDYIATHLAADPSNQMLFAASAESRTGNEYVTVHSLNADAGMLAYKYKLGVAPANAPRPTLGAAPPPRQLTKVASLSAFGGGLRNTCAAAYQQNVQVFDTHGLSPPGGPGSCPPTGYPPKGFWRAHDSAPISCLTPSLLGGAWVVTGARDGNVVLWDLRQRPPANAWRSHGHSQLVSGLQVTSDITLVTASQDSKVHIWDLRSNSSPKATAVPDGSAVLGLKASPQGDCVAVITQRNVLMVDLMDNSAAVSAVTTSPLARPFLDITWNSTTGELYAAGATGAVTVYRQVYV